MGWFREMRGVLFLGVEPRLKSLVVIERFRPRFGESHRRCGRWAHLKVLERAMES